jgi:hypothetical protein
MGFINGRSSECSKSELDIFSVPQTQLSIESVENIWYKPVCSIEDDSPLEFSIPASNEEYLDVGNTFLYIVASIITDTNESLKEDAKCGPINNWLHSIFADVGVTLNSKLISPPSHLYPYRSYFENTFNYNDSAKSTHQTLSLYYKDTAGKMDASDAANIGFFQRQNFIKQSKSVAMYGRLAVDIFGQSKYLINGVPMSIILTRAKPGFCIMSSDESGYKVKIHSAALQIRRAKISPSILLAHSKVLSSSNAKYPISRVDMKNFTIPQGLQSFNIDNLIVGQLPVRVLIAFTQNSAVNGSYARNPFNFQHFDMNYLSLTKDGVPVTSKPLQPNFSGNNIDYVQSYYSSFSGTGINFSDDGWSISRLEYPDGYVIHCFDLTADQSAGSQQWTLRKNGVLGLEVKFEKATTETLSVILYAEYQNRFSKEYNL